MKQILVLACVLTTLFLNGCSAQEDSDSANSTMLDIAALAEQRKDLEEAGVLFLKSKARYQLDRIVYPPVGTGSNDPGVLKAALGSSIGSGIMRKLAADPKTLLKVVKRLENWQPQFPADYNPGWKYKHKIDDDGVAKAIAKVRAEMLPGLRKNAILLADERYQNCLKETAELRKKSDYGTLPLIKQYEQSAKLHKIEWELIPESRWHKRVGWKAEDFFKDAKVIELCKAIEVNDLKAMKKLIDAGVNVNAKGIGNMTPLLWSYSDYKFERFQMLLDAGAGPNVTATSDFNIGREQFHPYSAYRGMMYEQFQRGSSVNIMAYQTVDSRFAWAVLKHGGDVNQIEPKTGRAPLHFVLNQFPWGPDKLEMVKALIDKGANLELPDPYRNNQLPLQWALEGRGIGSEYAMIFLEAGADPNAKTDRNRQPPIQMLLRKEAFIPADKPDQVLEYQKLKDLMVKNGGDFETALNVLNNGPAWGKALTRQKDLEDLHRDLESERKKRGGPPLVHKNWNSRLNSNYICKSPQIRQRWEKYYQHTSREFSEGPHHSGIAFSIKHVSKDELDSVETSLPDFAARGDKMFFVSPSFSGIPEWLYGNGDVMVDYLRSLADKKCKLMTRKSSDFADLPDNTDGYYFIEVASNKRHHELLIPGKYLLDEELRREVGLEAFADIWKLLDTLKRQAMLGDVEQKSKLFSEVNKQMRAAFPFPDSKEQFFLHHLTSAKLDDSGKLHCTMELPEREAGKEWIYTATCTRDGDQLTTKVTRKSK